MRYTPELPISRGIWKILSIRQITVYLHWTFLFAVSWLMVLNINNNRLDEWLNVVITIFSLLMSVVLHEVGHLTTAAFYGLHLRNLILMPAGSVIEFKQDIKSAKQELMINLAGPATNFMIAAIVMLFFIQWPLRSAMFTGPQLFHGKNLAVDIAMFNLRMGLLNIIPAFPFDGGRIARSFLRFRIDFQRSTLIVLRTGDVAGLLLMITGIVFSNPVPAVIGAFILLSGGDEVGQLRLRRLVEQLCVGDVTSPKFGGFQSDTTVRYAAPEVMKCTFKYFLVMENGEVAGVLQRLEILKAYARDEINLTLGSMISEKIETVDGNTPLSDIIRTLYADPDKPYPVSNGGKFAGIVNYNEVLEQLLMQNFKVNVYAPELNPERFPITPLH